MISGTGIQGSESAAPEAPSRRRFLRRASGVGAAVVGAIAVTWTDAPAALAGNLGCCDLAYPNGPWCGGHRGMSNFSCPSGYHKTAWYCNIGNDGYGCYECSKSSTSCYGGPWACSNYTVTVGGGG